MTLVDRPHGARMRVQDRRHEDVSLVQVDRDCKCYCKEGDNSKQEGREFHDEREGAGYIDGRRRDECPRADTWYIYPKV